MTGLTIDKVTEEEISDKSMMSRGIRSRSVSQDHDRSRQ